MKHLKYFPDSQTVGGGVKVDLPNVSYLEGKNTLFVPGHEGQATVVYNSTTGEIEVEIEETQIVCTLNVETAGTYYLSSNVSNFSKMYIDGVEMAPSTSYNFTTTGIHSVKFDLIDNTTLPNLALGNENYIVFYKTVTIPNSVTTFGYKALAGITYADTIEIGNSVVDLGTNTFADCDNLKDVIIHTATPPTFEPSRSSMQHIYVPAESVNAYKAASGWSKFSSKIQAIP